MAGARPTPALARRQRTARAGVEGWSGRHPQSPDHWRHIATELVGTQVSTRRLVAYGHAGKEAADVGSDCAC